MKTEFFMAGWDSGSRWGASLGTSCEIRTCKKLAQCSAAARATTHEHVSKGHTSMFIYLYL